MCDPSETLSRTPRFTVIGRLCRCYLHTVIKYGFLQVNANFYEVKDYTVRLNNYFVAIETNEKINFIARYSRTCTENGPVLSGHRPSCKRPVFKVPIFRLCKRCICYRYKAATLQQSYVCLSLVFTPVLSSHPGWKLSHMYSEENSDAYPNTLFYRCVRKK